jgi:hypothetical protein
MENIDTEPMTLYYQVDYTLTEVPEDAAYFHAQFRRSNPLPYKKDYVLLDGVQGWGHYVGTYIAWGVNNTGWWGEGEIKFFMDDDGSAALAPRITFAALTTSRTRRRGATRSSTHPTPGCIRSFALTAFTNPNNVSVSIVGTSWTRFASRRT